MKKQKLQLVILVVLLAALAGGYFGLKQYNKAQSEKPQETEGEVIVSVAAEDITKFSYDYEDNNYAYEKEDGTWYYTLNHSLNLTQYRIENMLSNVAEIVASQVIEGVTDMSQYGLDDSSRTISFETAGESYIFKVGDYNSMASVYYICKPSGTTVYCVPAMTVNAFNTDVLELVEEEEETSGTETGETEASVTETAGTEP